MIVGKVLTVEFLEKQHQPKKLDECTKLDLREQAFRMIAFDQQAIQKLKRVTHIDLSNNHLEHIYELVDLPNLIDLNLAHNSIISLVANSTSSSGGSGGSVVNSKLENEVFFKIYLKSQNVRHLF